MFNSMYNSESKYWMAYCGCIEMEMKEMINKNKNLTEEEIRNNIIEDLSSNHKYLDALTGLMYVYTRAFKFSELSNITRGKHKKYYMKVKPEYRDNLIELARECYNFMNTSDDEERKFINDCEIYFNLPRDTYIFLLFSYLDTLELLEHGSTMRCAYVNKKNTFDYYLEYF